MGTRWWVIGISGVALLSVGCTREQVSGSTPVEQSEQPSAHGETIPLATPAAQLAPSPRVSPPIQPLPVPSLIPPTAPQERLPQITVGRAEPFSAIATTPTVQSPPPATPPVPSSAPAPSVATNPIIPEPTLVSPPRLAPSPVVVNQIPAVPVPSAATPPPEIEVSGIVQIGTEISAIVRVPGESTSRSVREGESLTGGIVVQRIEIGENQEPMVILEQNGVQIARPVGSQSPI